MHGPSIAKHSITVERDFVSLPKITLEKSKLLQVLDNLIKNAVEAMVATDRELHTLKIITRHEEEHASITVTDTGCGISEEQLKQIFRFGFTTKTSGNGFGLHSAAIARDEMGGTIRVSSGGTGNGAAFGLTLPLHAEPEPETSFVPLIDPFASDVPIANELA